MAIARVYTGFEDCFLFIKKLQNSKYIIDSKDRAFIEYYVGFDLYNTYSEAEQKILQLKTLHKLDRFSVRVAA